MSCLGLTLCVFAGSLASAADPIPETPALVADSAQDSVAKPVVHRGRTIRLEERTVVSSKGDVSGTQWTLGRDELSQGTNLVDLLERIPGVEVQRTGGLGGYAEVRLRECPSSQVRVTLDGVSLGGSDGSTVDLGNIATEGLERVEVLQSGSAGSEGHPEIRLVSRHAWSQLGASGTVGSFGERKLNAWWGDSAGVWSASGWVQRADNNWPIEWDRGTPYNTADDTVIRLKNNDYESWGGVLSWRPTDRISADLRGESSDKGISGLYLEDPVARYVRQSAQFSLASRGEDRWDLPWELAGRLRHSRWTDSAGTVDYRSNREAEELGWNASGGFGIVGHSQGWFDPWIHLGIDLEGSHWTTETPKQVHLSPDATRQKGTLELGWKGEDEAATKGASALVSWGLARDERDFANSSMMGIAKSADSSSWRGSWEARARLWTQSRDRFWQTWLGGARSIRVPDFFEIYGDNGLTFQNLALRPEQSWTAEFGGRLSGDVWSFGATPWIGLYQDPIRRQILGSSPASRYYNDSGYTAVGMDGDASLNGRFGRLRLQGTLERTWLNSAYAAVRGHEMERIPHWKCSMTAGTPTWRGLSGEYVLEAQGMSWKSPLNTPGETVPGRVLHDLRVRFAWGQVSLALACENLTDVRFEEWADAPLSGRSWRAQLEFNLRKSTKDPS